MTHEPNLFDQICNSIRLKRSRICTGQAHVDWVKGFIPFHQKRHLVAMRAEAIGAAAAPHQSSDHERRAVAVVMDDYP